jgi:D-3-phosphoglycerate dehydrogenase / 2-oxoglutarate reductase
VAGATVVVTDYPFGQPDIERRLLEPLGVELVVAPDASEETLVALAERAAGLLVCYAPVTEAVVEAAAGAGCRVIARYGIGYDNVDVAAASRAGIPVTNVPDYCLDEVADHTMALLLSFARRIVRSAEEVRAGGWDLPSGEVRRLAGSTLALAGAGGIGRRVARRAQSFGLRVTAHDPFVSDWSELDGVTRAETLEEAVGRADFVSLHAPLTPETKHLVGASLIASMENAPVLINTARGGLVDLDAVAAALDDGRLRGAALDVTEVEPLPADHPLRSHPAAVVTPHMSFYSVEAQEELLTRAAAEVVRALGGEPPDRPVNPEVLEGLAR